MIKLSELPMDAILTVLPHGSEDPIIMDKEDFLATGFYFHSSGEPMPEVTLADKTIERFDLFDVIERIGDGSTYEGWDLDVYGDLKDQPETKAFLSLLREVFECRPTYWEGEPIEIDMLARSI